jgi:hypothetical protein
MDDKYVQKFQRDLEQVDTFTLVVMKSQYRRGRRRKYSQIGRHPATMNKTVRMSSNYTKLRRTSSPLPAGLPPAQSPRSVFSWHRKP